MPLVIEVTRHQVAGASGMYSLPILFLLLSFSKKFTGNLLLWISIFASAIVVYLASARAPTVGYITIFLIYKRSLSRYITFLAIATIILFFVSNTEYAEFANERAERLISSEPRTGVPSEVEFRMMNVEYGIESFRDRPIFGVGYTNWLSIYERHSSVLNYALSAHNGYVKILSETGLVGVVLFILMILTTLWGTNFYYTKNFNQKLLYTSSILIFSVFILSIGSDEIYGRSLYIFLALALGAKLRIREHQVNQQLNNTCLVPTNSYPTAKDNGSRSFLGPRD